MNIRRHRVDTPAREPEESRLQVIRELAERLRGGETVQHATSAAISKQALKSTGVGRPTFEADWILTRES